MFIDEDLFCVYTFLSLSPLQIINTYCFDLLFSRLFLIDVELKKKRRKCFRR